MIAGVIVEEGEEFVASGGVYNLIYPRQTKGVFRVVFIEISVINTVDEIWSAVYLGVCPR